MIMQAIVCKEQVLWHIFLESDEAIVSEYVYQD